MLELLFGSTESQVSEENEQLIRFKQMIKDIESTAETEKDSDL
jgi:hypothetical protein